MTERLAQIAWVLEFWGDVVSDMSAFHRVEEVEAMSARRFFSLAIRLPAYSGALTARLSAAAPAQASAVAQPAATASAPPDRTGVRAGPHPGSSWSFATAGGDA